jgi:hypothetical protein
MLKQTKATLIFAAGVLFATSAMGQGRGTGKPEGIAVHGGGHGILGGPSGQSSVKPKPASLALDSHGSAPGAKSPVTWLEQNTKLASKLATFFPDGTDLSKQASGFKNLGQFVSAVHVSHNLGIPFDNLKCAELGTTAATQEGVNCPPSVGNSDPISLGKAIQNFRPDANAQHAIQEANHQAEKDLQDSSRK